MHNTIWKFPLTVTDTQFISLPKDAEILCVQVQMEAPCLWAKVDSTIEDKETVLIETFGTGHPMDEKNRKYIGTYQLNNGHLIFHVFRHI
jgi:hypothetical protein